MFFTKKINHIGYITRLGQLEVADHTNGAIRNVKTLTAQTELLSFIGLSNALRTYLPNAARIDAPLTDQLRKEPAKQFVQLNVEELTALRTLHEKLISRSVMALQRKEGHYTVDTDASGRQIGCVFLQQKDDNVDGQAGC